MLLYVSRGCGLKQLHSKKLCVTERMRFAQLVMGPAGSGKSTYCTALAAHAQVRTETVYFVPLENYPKFVQDAKRTISVVNLDPAAEFFNYQPLADIRDLIQVSLSI